MEKSTFSQKVREVKKMFPCQTIRQDIKTPKIIIDGIHVTQSQISTLEKMSNNCRVINFVNRIEPSAKRAFIFLY